MNQEFELPTEKFDWKNISADKMCLSVEEWLKKSYQIRLRHESAHYDTLRLLGGMKNHAQDEVEQMTRKATDEFEIFKKIASRPIKG